MNLLEDPVAWSNKSKLEKGERVGPACALVGSGALRAMRSSLQALDAPARFRISATCNNYLKNCGVFNSRARESLREDLSHLVGAHPEHEIHTILRITSAVGSRLALVERILAPLIKFGDTPLRAYGLGIVSRWCETDLKHDRMLKEEGALKFAVHFLSRVMEKSDPESLARNMELVDDLISDGIMRGSRVYQGFSGWGSSLWENWMEERLTPTLEFLVRARREGGLFVEHDLLAPLRSVAKYLSKNDFAVESARLADLIIGSRKVSRLSGLCEVYFQGAYITSAIPSLYQRGCSQQVLDFSFKLLSLGIDPTLYTGCIIPPLVVKRPQDYWREREPHALQCAQIIGSLGITDNLDLEIVFAKRMMEIDSIPLVVLLNSQFKSLLPFFQRGISNPYTSSDPDTLTFLLGRFPVEGLESLMRLHFALMGTPSTFAHTLQEFGSWCVENSLKQRNSKEFSNGFDPLVVLANVVRERHVNSLDTYTIRTTELEQVVQQLVQLGIERIPYKIELLDEVSHFEVACVDKAEDFNMGYSLPAIYPVVDSNQRMIVTREA